MLGTPFKDIAACLTCYICESFSTHYKFNQIMRNFYRKFVTVVHIISILGTLSNDDDKDNNNVKKQLVLWAKQLLCTCITLFSTFLWRPLHDYDVKPPNATFYGGRGHTTTNFPFSIWTWIKPLRIQLQEKSPTFDELSGFQIDTIKFERTQIHFFSDVVTAVVVVVVA